MNQSPISLIASRLTIERKQSGISIAELARRAKIAKSTLSQLENGVGNPSIETLWSLCIALEIPVSALLDSPKPKTTVIRRGEGLSVTAHNNDYRATLLAASPSGVSRDIYWIEVLNGKPHQSEPHHKGTIEHIVITKGKAKIGLKTDSYELNEGDYITYPADLPHIFEALTESVCAMLISEYR